jgi:hypothetical protein
MFYRIALCPMFTGARLSRPSFPVREMGSFQLSGFWMVKRCGRLAGSTALAEVIAGSDGIPLLFENLRKL